MKVVKRILVGVLVLVAVLAAVGFLLPAQTHIERSVEVAASPSETFGLVNDLPTWERWDPWYELEPTAVRTYSTPAAGTGASYRWVGDKTGSGTITITKTEPNRLIETALSFDGQGEAAAAYHFREISPDQTEVRWTFDSDHGMNIVSRWFGLAFESMLGKDFEKGLAQLKALAESEHQANLAIGGETTQPEAAAAVAPAQL